MPDAFGEPTAQLNVTYAGQQGDYPDPVSYDASDADIKQIAAEALMTGYITGIDAVAEPDLTDFMVDRFSARDGLPDRLVLRPKTPFGNQR